MTKILIAAAVAALSLSTQAFAWEGKKVACYDKIWIPATYKTKKVLEYPAKKKWEHIDGQLVEMYYPPVYKVTKYVKMKGHYELRKAPCN